MSESITGSQPVFLIREHNAAASVADFLTDAPTLYEKVFCARGSSENLMKDMKRWTRSDKTACSRWQAN